MLSLTNDEPLADKTPSLTVVGITIKRTEHHPRGEKSVTAGEAGV